MAYAKWAASPVPHRFSLPEKEVRKIPMLACDGVSKLGPGGATGTKLYSQVEELPDSGCRKIHHLLLGRLQQDRTDLCYQIFVFSLLLR